MSRALKLVTTAGRSIADFVRCGTGGVDELPDASAALAALADIELQLQNSLFSVGSDQLHAANASIVYLEESRKAFTTALEAIQGIHPTVALVVAAFKVAIELEFQRRENDRKVRTVYVAMTYMMSVLFDIYRSSYRHTANDSKSETLNGALTRVVSDIRECTVTCEAYHKESIIMKIVRANEWEIKLQTRLEAFQDRRNEIRDGLLIQIAIYTVPPPWPELLDKMENQKLQTFIKNHIKANKDKSQDEALDALYEDLQEHKQDLGNDSLPQYSSSVEFRDAALAELKTSVEALLEKERKTIEQKFEDITKHLDAAKNEIIDAIKAGGHTSITDAAMKEVWRRMSWKADSVQAAHFAVAVRDYYVQLYAPRLAADGPSASILLPSTLPDAWAIQYISIGRIRPIMDAIDEDSSGWISVREVNTFASLGRLGRPQDWTLLKWFAYWAAGYPAVCEYYAKKIAAIRVSMVQLAPRLLPCNRGRAGTYLNWSCLTTVDQLVRATLEGFDPWDNQSRVPDYFQTYVNAEEERLRDGLKRYNWNFRHASTLSLITGGGRIERYIFPLLFLVLERHLLVLRYACHDVIAFSELYDAIDPIVVIVQQAVERYNALGASFRIQNRDPKLEFSLSCSGMFSLLYEDENKVDALEYEAGLWDGYYIAHDEEKNAASLLQYAPTLDDCSYGEVTHGWISCDACDERIHGARFRCLECERPQYSINICGSKPECYNKQVFVEREGILHTPQHAVLKTYRFIPRRDRARIVSLAKRAEKKSSKLFQPHGLSAAIDTESVLGERRCVACETVLSGPPCWMCVECDDPRALLCVDCESMQPDLIQRIDAYRMERVKKPEPAHSPAVSAAASEHGDAIPLSPPVAATTPATPTAPAPGPPTQPLGKDDVDDTTDSSSKAEAESTSESTSDTGSEFVDGDDMQRAFYKSHSEHKWWHVLVRVRPPPPPPRVDDSVEAKLTLLENKLIEIDNFLRRERTGDHHVV